MHVPPILHIFYLTIVAFSANGDSVVSRNIIDELFDKF